MYIYFIYSHRTIITSYICMLATLKRIHYMFTQMYVGVGVWLCGCVCVGAFMSIGSTVVKSKKSVKVLIGLD